MIQGHVSSRRGAISSRQSEISSLNAGRYRASDADTARIARHEAEIARVEREIRGYGADARIASIEKELAARAANRKVAAIDQEIRAFDLEATVGAIVGRIAAPDVNRRATAIERQIESLDADRRTRQLEERRDDELKRLAAAIAAIRQARARYPPGGAWSSPSRSRFASDSVTSGSTSSAGRPKFAPTRAAISIGVLAPSH